jgi:hypothetical protein
MLEAEVAAAVAGAGAVVAWSHWLGRLEHNRLALSELFLMALCN